MGPAGAAGGTLQVTDGTGATVANVVSVRGWSVQVLVGSGVYDYRWDGRLQVDDSSFHYFVGATCSGTRVIPFAGPMYPVGGPLRIVVRNVDSTVVVLAVGPQQVLPAGTVVSTYLGSPPTCLAIPPLSAAATVTTLLVDSAPVPPDLPGPLRLTLT